jgi:hypothetical protein
MFFRISYTSAGSSSEDLQHEASAETHKKAAMILFVNFMILLF